MRAGRFVAAAAAVMAMLAPAAAQDGQSRIRVYLYNGLELDIDRPAPGQHEDEIEAALRAAFATEDNSHIAIQTGARRAGEEVIVIDDPYRNLSRLEHDVFKRGTFGGRVLVFPAGAVLFHERADNPVFGLNQRPISLGLRMACGARPDAAAPGACLIQRSSGWEVADIRSPTPFVLKELGPSVPVLEAPVLVADPQASLPARVSGYRFVAWSSTAVRLMRFARAGDVDVELGEVRVPLNNGVARTQVGTLSVHFRRGEDGAVLVEQTPAEITPEVARAMRHAADNLSHAARIAQSQ